MFSTQYLLKTFYKQGTVIDARHIFKIRYDLAGKRHIMCIVSSVVDLYEQGVMEKRGSFLEVKISKLNLKGSLRIR